jgi:hypothetical protein
VGVAAEDGIFHPLRPGMRIQIFAEPRPSALPTENTGGTPMSETAGAAARPEQRIWVPDPLKGSGAARLKYGVLLEKRREASDMTGDIYETAYLEKLERLIEKEIHTPVAVILDRRFTAPHLASGSPREIALAMWQELEEVRAPVSLVKAWLENPGQESVEGLAMPGAVEEGAEAPVSEPQLRKEQEALTLDDFLALL